MNTTKVDVPKTTEAAQTINPVNTECVQLKAVGVANRVG